MKQESVFGPFVLKDSTGRISSRIVSATLLTILVAAILAISSYMLGSVIMSGNASVNFHKANPEVRYAQHAGVLSSQMETANFLTVNPEAHYAHLDAAELAIAAESAYLIRNPEAHYAGYSVIDTSKNGSGDFFEANPEVAFNQRYLDAEGLK